MFREGNEWTAKNVRYMVQCILCCVNSVIWSNIVVAYIWLKMERKKQIMKSDTEGSPQKVEHMHEAVGHI